MSLSDENFKFSEANHFLADLLQLRLLRNDQRCRILPTNVLLYAYPYTGRVKAFTYDFQEIEAVKFDFDRLVPGSDYERYIVLPLTIHVNREGESSAEIFQRVYSNNETEYDDACAHVDSELTVQHQLCVIIDRKTRIGSLIDINYAPWTDYANEKECITHRPQYDALLQSVQHFFTQNDALVEFQASMPGIDSQGHPTGNPWVRPSLIRIERFDALYFSRDLVMTESNPGTHLGTCVPSTYLLVEWIINGGGVNERLAMLRKEGTSLHGLVLELAQTAVEVFYPQEVLGLYESRLVFQNVMAQVEKGLENVGNALKGVFDARENNAYIMQLLIRST